jgi:hypothetical protein
VSYRLKAGEWAAQLPAPYRKAGRDMLLKMGELKRRGSYTEYLPLDYSNPQNQRFVGEVLGELWALAWEAELPMINMLVGRADLDLIQSPDGGVGKWYQGLFGTLKGFEAYCSRQADLAALMLQEGVIVIEP